MYRFIVLYVCIYVAPWSCEARHFVPLYVPTCSGMTIKLNLNLIPNLLRCVFHSRSSQDRSPSLREESNGSFSPRLDHREDIKQSCSCPKHTHLSYQRTLIRFMTSFYLAFGGFSLTLNAPPPHEALQKDNQVKMVVCRRNNKRSFNTSVTSTLP